MAFLLIVACSKDDDGDSNTIGGISNVGADIDNATIPNNVSSDIEATNEDSISNSHGKTKLPVSFKVSQNPSLSKLGILSDDGDEIQLKFEVGDELSFEIRDIAKRNEEGDFDYETGYLGKACFSLTEDGIIEDGKYAMFYGEIEIDADSEVEELGFGTIRLTTKDFDNDPWAIKAYTTLDAAIRTHCYYVWYQESKYTVNNEIDIEKGKSNGSTTILEILTNLTSLDMQIGASWGGIETHHFDIENDQVYIYLGFKNIVTCEALGLKDKQISEGKISRLDHRGKEYGISVKDMDCVTW